MLISHARYIYYIQDFKILSSFQLQLKDPTPRVSPKCQLNAALCAWTCWYIQVVSSINAMFAIEEANIKSIGLTTDLFLSSPATQICILSPYFRIFFHLFYSLGFGLHLVGGVEYNYILDTEISIFSTIEPSDLK